MGVYFLKIIRSFLSSSGVELRGGKATRGEGKEKNLKERDRRLVGLGIHLPFSWWIVGGFQSGTKRSKEKAKG